LIFFRTFLLNPQQVGSITPSSRFLKERMARSIDFGSARYIAEYGAGTGAITRELLRHARPDAKIICFETNAGFCAYLCQSLADPRLVIINDGAESIQHHQRQLGLPAIDYVISSLPFSQLAERQKRDIMKATCAALAPHGKFILYRYTFNFSEYLTGYFRRISRKFVLRNLPPTFIYVCHR
jgi:phospholipid N-methyltransferase